MTPPASGVRSRCPVPGSGPGPGPHLPVELLLVLHPHVLSERVVVGVELVAQDDLVADRHVGADVAETRIFHFRVFFVVVVVPPAQTGHCGTHRHAGFNRQKHRVSDGPGSL